jgi:DNA polymerase-3 subunit beta
MKVTLSKHDLSVALATVQAAIPNRPTHPVLANVRLVASEATQQIKLIGFDLSLGIKTTFGAVVTEDGDVAIPAKLLSSIVSKLPEGAISLECATDSTLVTLTSLTGSYELRGMSTEDYPELPEVNAEVEANLTVEQLKTGLSGSLYAASNDETKQVLCGVHMTLNTDSLEFAATDGHRLAIVHLSDVEDAFGKLALTIPASVLAQVKFQVSKLDDEYIVKVQASENQVQFDLADNEIKARLLEGSYPQYHQLLPQHFERSVVVDRRELIAALERVAVIAERKNNLIKFNFQTNKLHLEVDTEDVGRGQESLVTQSQGDEILIAFNAPGSPALIKPLGGVAVTHLVMPVQIRD